MYIYIVTTRPGPPAVLLKINNTHTTIDYTHYMLDDEYSLFHVETYKGLSPSMNYC